MICHLIKPQYRFAMTLSILRRQFKDKYIKVTISKIVERNDALNEKVVLVNEYLSKICKTMGLPIIKNDNIKPLSFKLK